MGCDSSSGAEPRNSSDPVRCHRPARSGTSAATLPALASADAGRGRRQLGAVLMNAAGRRQYRRPAARRLQRAAISPPGHGRWRRLIPAALPGDQWEGGSVDALDRRSPGRTQPEGGRRPPRGGQLACRQPVRARPGGRSARMAGEPDALPPAATASSRRRPGSRGIDSHVDRLPQDVARSASKPVVVAGASGRGSRHEPAGMLLEQRCL